MDARSQVPTAHFSDNRNQPLTSPAPSSNNQRNNSTDLRSQVAKRFMRMLRLHDRARNQLLSAHSSQTR